MSRLVRLLTISVLLLALPAWAEEFARRDGNLEVLRIDSPRVDLTLKEIAVREAKKSVSVFSMSQTTDEQGIRMIQALRDVQKKGVPVKYFHEATWTTLFNGETRQAATRMLVDSSLTCPGQVICGNPLMKMRSGLAFDDLMHLKILVIDAGEPTEKIFIGGRGYGRFDRDVTIDMGYLLRPIDSSKPYVGTDLKLYCDDLFSTMGEKLGLSKPRPLPKSLQERAEAPLPAPKMSAVEQQTLDLMTAIMREPIDPNVSPLHEFQSRPQSATLVGNGFFNRVIAEQMGRSFRSRMALADNPINRKIAEMMQRGNEAELNAFVLAFSPPLRQTLLDFIARGGDLKLFTNGFGAHRALGPGLQLVTNYTIKEMFPFMKAAQRLGKGSLSVNFLEPALIPSEAADTLGRYIHRKELVVGDLVMTGSDNFTLSADTKNEEAMVVFDDPKLAQALRDRNRREAAYYEQISIDRMSQLRRRLTVPHRLCNLLFQVLY